MLDEGDGERIVDEELEDLWREEVVVEEVVEVEVEVVEVVEELVVEVEEVVKLSCPAEESHCTAKQIH